MANSDTYIQQLLNSESFVLQVGDIGLDQVVSFLSNTIKRSSKPINPIYLIGGAASGKTTLAEALAKIMKNAVVISTDDFVKGTRDWRREFIVSKNLNPLLKYDFGLLENKIKELTLDNFKPVLLPKYNELTGLAITDSEANYRRITSKPDFIIIEGDFKAISNPGLQIYLHSSDELRTSNRIQRDQKQRNEVNLDKLVKDIQTRDQQQHFPFTLPNAETSDLIITVNKINTTFVYSIYRKTNYEI